MVTFTNSFCYFDTCNGIYKLLIKNRLKINLATPIPKGGKLIFFAPLGVGVNEENQ
jgi:hypothetical protein